MTLAAPPVVPLLLPLQSRNLQIDDVLFRLHPVKAGVAGLSRRGGRRRNVGRLYPSEAYVTLNSEQRKAMADQLSIVSKLRPREKIGRLSREDIAAIERAICLQLAL